MRRITLEATATFGELTVIRATNKRDKYGAALTLFRCSCGKCVLRSAPAVKRGTIKSCGHLRKKLGHQKALKLAPGVKIHRWLVLEDKGSDMHRKQQFLCQCECGFKAIILGQNLRHGLSRSCGGPKCRVRD